MQLKCASCGRSFNRPSWRKLGNEQFCSKHCPVDTNYRFWRNVNKTDSCWIWTGLISTDGYGKYCRSDGTWRAHRFSWTITNGEIPQRLEVLHNCPNGDNKLCVNPLHLFLGTNADNRKDAVKKGQTAAGTRNGNSKLFEAEILDIKARYNLGQSQTLLADEFGVTQAEISAIVRIKIWKHIHAGNV